MKIIFTKSVVIIIESLIENVTISPKSLVLSACVCLVSEYVMQGLHYSQFFCKTCHGHGNEFNM